MYKQKLYLLLKALEVENIEELMEKEPYCIEQVGLSIAKYSKFYCPQMESEERHYRTTVSGIGIS